MMDTVATSVNDDVIALIAVGGGLCIAALWMVMHYVSHIMKAKAREETRREVAAYVAEGSIAPEDAVAILTAGDAADMAKTMAAMGASPKKIEQMMAAARHAR